MARKSLAELLDGVTRFGRWAVLCEGEPRISGKSARRTASCRCDCGTARDVLIQSLSSGQSQNCGCEISQSLRSAAKRMGLANGRHKQSNSPEYNSWHSMRVRCLCVTDKAYGRYGARGIHICSEWDSFERFLKDMGPRPSSKHSLERLDNDKGYGPDNCAWRTATAQNRNRRNTLSADFRGQTMPLGEIAEITGVNYGLLWRRVVQLGWSIERAVTEPSRKA